MASRPKPKTYDSVVALMQRLELRWEGGEGDAIATAFDGDAMLYLVVARAGDTIPRWIAEDELSAAALART
jgi:hypothetical protein